MPERLCECGCGQPPREGFRVALKHSYDTNYYNPDTRPKHTKYKPPKPAMKRRDCLRCNRTFLSEGPHHRLCSRCREALNTEPTPEAIAHLGARGVGSFVSL